MSGVPAAEIERIALELATADGGVAYGRMGVSTHEFGSVCQWAVNLLNIVTGNLDPAAARCSPRRPSTSSAPA